MMKHTTVVMLLSAVAQLILGCSCQLVGNPIGAPMLLAPPVLDQSTINLPGSYGMVPSLCPCAPLPAPTCCNAIQTDIGSIYRHPSPVGMPGLYPVSQPYGVQQPSAPNGVGTYPQSGMLVSGMEQGYVVAQGTGQGLSPGLPQQLPSVIGSNAQSPYLQQGLVAQGGGYQGVGYQGVGYQGVDYQGLGYQSLGNQGPVPPNYFMPSPSSNQWALGSGQGMSGGMAAGTGQQYPSSLISGYGQSASPMASGFGANSAGYAYGPIAPQAAPQNIGYPPAIPNAQPQQTALQPSPQQLNENENTNMNVNINNDLSRHHMRGLLGLQKP